MHNKLLTASTRRLLIKPHPLRPLSTSSSSSSSSPLVGDGATTFSGDGDLGGAVERAYRILRRFHSDPSKLALALSSARVDPAAHPALVERVLSRCGAAAPLLALRFFSWSSSLAPPSPAARRLLLRALARSRRFDAAWALLSDLRRLHPELLSPDLFVALIRRFAAARLVSRALDVLDQMPRYGLPADDRVFGALLDALCKHGSVREAANLFEEMRERFPPDLRHFTSLLYGWRIDKAYEFVSEMARRGFRPDSRAYFPIFAAHEKKEQLEECLELMDRMRKDGSFPDLGIHEVVIRLSCKLGELTQAVAIWNEMENRGVSPDLDTFLIMIHGFVGQSALVDACGYFKEMVGRGLFVAPQYGVLKDLLNALLRDEKLELAKEMWGCIASKGCELNVSAWTIWIHALFSNKHVKEACSYCLDMLDSGLMPQADTFAKLMKGLKKLYNRQIAAEITEKVRKMAEERRVSFKMYKRRGVRDLEEKANKKRKREKERKGRKGRALSRGHSRSRHRQSNLDDDEELDS
uniref:Pentatricopeptide repeat-containing protein n=1 Tax=Ananas comosus var. bracteatus TaxID=296719 RepID=A0A6V7Q2I1_ANACO|nr:unnamed protein product [Ananas comosus var. bracteatus]